MTVHQDDADRAVHLYDADHGGSRRPRLAAWHRRFDPPACALCGTNGTATERFLDHQGVVWRLRCTDVDACDVARGIGWREAA